MPIDFYNFGDADGWIPVDLDAMESVQLCHDGRPWRESQIDIAAALGDGILRSTRLDPTFSMVGYRCRPDFQIPRLHHNYRELVIVFAGSLTVEWVEMGATASREVRRGQFWVSDPDTPRSITAGSDGVTFVESWHPKAVDRATFWHDDAGISHDTGR